MISPKIIVVGAGVSGLSVAYRLQERMPTANVRVLEAGDRPGGTAWSLREAGFVVEIGPNGFLDTKPTTLNLSREIGLTDRLVQSSESAAKNRYLFLGDQLKPLPAGFTAFLQSDLLSWRGKLSLLWERFRGKRTDTTDESIDAFVRRRAGNEAADVFADALVTGIYAGDPKLLSLPACFPRIAELEREYGSVIKGFAGAAKKRRAEAQKQGLPYQRAGKMWSFQGGMRTFVEGLTARLRQAPEYGVAIRTVRRSADSGMWTVHGEGNEAFEADAIVLTCPAWKQAELLAEADEALAGQIAAIPYNRVAVIALAFRQGDVPTSTEGFGFIAPQNTRRDLLGVQWCSSIYPNRVPDGTVLLRAMAGGWHRADVVDWDDAKLLAAIRAELRLAMKITAEPIFNKIIRWNRAIPQYHLGHLERVARIEASAVRHPGLLLGGNAYHGVALNDCTEQGSVLAERVANFLRHV